MSADTTANRSVLRRVTPRRIAMRAFRIVSLGGLAALASLALASCSRDDAVVTVTITSAPPSASVSPSPAAATVSPSASPSASAPAISLTEEEAEESSAPFTADTAPDTETASSGAFLSPVNLRFGAHDGYDRIVIDLEGTGTPGWNAEYVASPMAEGSGEPISLAGGAYLRVHITGVALPTEPGASAYAGPVDVLPATAGVVEQIKVGGVFEGGQDVFIGVESEQPFRVFLLTSPTRIVVDVQTP